MNHYRQLIHFDDGHPALPGHFPGHPLVPGVLMLEQVALGLRACCGQRLSRVIEAKFIGALLPGESAQLELSCNSANMLRTNFRIERDGTLLARGIVEGAP